MSAPYFAAMQQAAQSGVSMAAVGNGEVDPAGRRDYAEALAVVITGTGHDDRAYSLTSDTYSDPAAAMSEVTGEPVTYQPVTPEQYQNILTIVGLDEGTAAFLAALDENVGAGIIASTGDSDGLGRQTVRTTPATTWSASSATPPCPGPKVCTSGLTFPSRRMPNRAGDRV